MKKQVLTVSIAIFFALGSATFIGCGTSENNVEETENVEGTESAEHEGHDHSEEKLTGFQCGMDCEDGKVYDEEGECPICGMDLEAWEKEE